MQQLPFYPAIPPTSMLYNVHIQIKHTHLNELIQNFIHEQFVHRVKNCYKDINDLITRLQPALLRIVESNPVTMCGNVFSLMLL